jgi:hypothetical protein
MIPDSTYVEFRLMLDGANLHTNWTQTNHIMKSELATVFTFSHVTVLKIPFDTLMNDIAWK